MRVQARYSERGPPSSARKPAIPSLGNPAIPSLGNPAIPSLGNPAHVRNRRPTCETENPHA